MSIVFDYSDARWPSSPNEVFAVGIQTNPRLCRPMGEPEPAQLEIVMKAKAAQKDWADWLAEKAAARK